MLKGWPPRARRKTADWQRQTQTGRKYTTGWLKPKGGGTEIWEAATQIQVVVFNICVYKLLASVQRLHGKPGSERTCVGWEASWTTGMNESFHMNAQPCRCKNKNSFTLATALQDKFAIHTPQLLWHAQGHITLESDTCSLTCSPDDPGLSHRRSPVDPSRLKASPGPRVWRTYGWRAPHIFVACWEHMDSKCTTWIIHLRAYVLKHGIDVSLRHTWMAWRTVTGSEPKHKYTEGSWSQGLKFSSLHCLRGLHLAAVWWQSTSASTGHVIPRRNRILV